MTSISKTRVIEICLQRMQAGASVEETLSLYPRWSEELRPLLLAVRAVRSFGVTISVPEAAQARSRLSFLQAAQEMIPCASESRQAPLRRLFETGLILILIVMVGLGLSVSLSARVLPGTPFYPLKAAIQQGRLRLTRDPGRRFSLEHAFDQNQLAEVKTLIQQSRSLEVSFTGGLSQMDADEWLVEGFHVQIPADARMVGKIETGIYVTIQGRLQSDGTVVAHKMQARAFQIEGLLQSISPEELVISGVKVKTMPGTILQGSLSAGSRVRVVAWLSLSQDLEARVVEVLTK